ncbi:MAG: response regulator [bacterium]
MIKKRVLYAEDELSNRRLLQLKLEKADIECDVVEDGEEAIKMSRENDYDLIILDHYMPGIGGIEAAAKIRESSPDIPLLAITSDDALKDILLNAGFDEIIIKPFHGNDIINIIKSYL